MSTFSPIGPLTGSRNYTAVGDGRYALAGRTFGQPQEIISISRGKTQPKTGQTTASVAYRMEKDFTEGDDIFRRVLACQWQLQLTPGFTATDADTALSLISEFVTIDVLNAILLGRQ